MHNHQDWLSTTICINKHTSFCIVYFYDQTEKIVPYFPLSCSISDKSSNMKGEKLRTFTALSRFYELGENFII